MKVTALCKTCFMTAPMSSQHPGGRVSTLSNPPSIDDLRPITPAGLKIKLRLDYRHAVFGKTRMTCSASFFNLTHNVITLAHLSDKINRRMASALNLAWLRQAGRRYIIGARKSAARTERVPRLSPRHSQQSPTQRSGAAG